jgi:hypothetical protein
MLLTTKDQNHLISSLSARDTSSTRLYTLALSALPLLCVILYLPTLISLYTIPPSLFAITSLFASAYTLYFLPLPPVQVSIINTSELKARTSEGYGWNVPTPAATKNHDRRPVPYISEEIAERVGKYIVPANTAVCAFLALLELWQVFTWSGGSMVGRGYLPGIVLGVVLWARRELRVVDLGELEKLKFGSKTT